MGYSQKLAAYKKRKQNLSLEEKPRSLLGARIEAVARKNKM